MKTQQEQDEEIDQWVKDKLGFPKQLNKEPMNIQVNLEEQYKVFLNYIGAHKSPLSPEQDMMLRKTFYYTWAQCAILTQHMFMTDHISAGDIGNALQNQMDQVGEFIKNVNEKEGADMKIDLAEQYKLFLTRMALDESTMHQEQKKQIKETFYFTWAQCLLTIRDELGKDNASEDEGAESLQDQINQVGEFINEITGRKS